MPLTAKSDPLPAKRSRRSNVHHVHSYVLPILFLAIASLISANSQAHVVHMVAVGNATQFNAWAEAAHVASGANNNYSIGGFIVGGPPFAAMNDIRAGGIIPEEGALWVVWDNIPFPKTNIWAYLAVDSAVAVRGFYAAPRAKLLLNAAVLGTPGMNLVKAAGFPADSPLPAWVFNALTAPPATFDAVMTSETVVNALTITNQMLKNPPAAPTAYGYGPGKIGVPVLTTFGPVTRQPVKFALAGADPITALPVAKTLQQPLRRSLLVPFVNATNGAPGGLGNIIGGGFHDAAIPCAPPNGLAAALNGIAQTNQLLSFPGPALPLTVFLDDPLAGNWFFMEHNVMNSCPVPLNSQELAVNPPAGFPNNPLSLGGPGGQRERVIGKDMTIAKVLGTPDSLSYVTWTCSLAGLNTYLTVGKQGPWLGGWTGVFPPCNAMPNPNYPLQPMQFLVTDNPPAPGVAALRPLVLAQVPHENWP